MTTPATDPQVDLTVVRSAEPEDIAPLLPGATVEDWRSMEWVLPVYKQARRFRGTTHSSARAADGSSVEVHVAG